MKIANYIREIKGTNLDRRAYESVECGTVACTPEVSDRPDGRPQTDDVRKTRKNDRSLHISAREAGFVPDENRKKWQTQHYKTVRRPGNSPCCEFNVKSQSLNPTESEDISLTTLIVQFILFMSRKSDDHRTIRRGDCCGIVPL